MSAPNIYVVRYTWRERGELRQGGTVISGESANEAMANFKNLNRHLESVELDGGETETQGELIKK